MRAKQFLKILVIAASFQVALLVIICPLVSRAFENGRALPDFLLQYGYSPFIRAVIYVGGYQGERAMIWPPVYGVLLGVVVYSLVLALALSLVIRTGNRQI